jgi:hypothetical protein
MPHDLEGTTPSDIDLAEVQAIATIERVEFVIGTWLQFCSIFCRISTVEYIPSRPSAYSRLGILAFSIYGVLSLGRITSGFWSNQAPKPK